MQIWDTAGQERFHSLGPAFYRGCDCIIIVFDSTNSKSLANTAEWQREFVNQTQLVDPSTFPTYLVANKIDLTLKREVTSTQGRKAAQLLFEIALDMANESSAAGPVLAKLNLPIDFLGSKSIRARLRAFDRQQKDSNQANDVELDSFPRFQTNARIVLSPKASQLSLSSDHESVDSDGTKSRERKTSADDVFSFPYFEVSALTGDSIRALFNHIAIHVEPTTYQSKSNTVELSYESRVTPKRSANCIC
jgi:GTPase SAR1 family protein